MKPIEAAHMLFGANPFVRDTMLKMDLCFACGRNATDGHKAWCPWLAMPRIVKVLEAAQALVEETTMPVDCLTCMRPQGGHAPDCPWQALVAAMQEGAG